MNSRHAGSTFLLSQTGCFLPFLLFFNTFFGLLFLKPLWWLLVEGVLLFLLLFHSALVTRKVFTSTRSTPRQRQGKVIDVEGEIVDEGGQKRQKLK
jgi:membrane protein implicated in regulation of membrane protease activity